MAMPLRFRSLYLLGINYLKLGAVTKERTPRTHEERKAIARRKILKAAQKLFSKYGYRDTTLNQIGKEAGYTGSLVGQRFDSKEGLLKALVEDIARRFVDEQLYPLAESESGEDSIRNYVDVYLQEVTRRGSQLHTLYVIMGESLSAVPEIRPQIAELNRSVRGRMADRIERGIALGEFRSDIDADISSYMIVGLMRGLTMEILADRRSIDVSRLIPEVQQQVLGNLRQKR